MTPRDRQLDDSETILKWCILGAGICLIAAVLFDFYLLILERMIP